MLVIAALCGLALALAGCGGGGSKSSATPSTEANTTTTETTTAATTTTATTTSQSTTAAPNFATSGNCKDLANSATELSNALTGAKGDIQKSAQLLQQFADKAPSEIRSDIQTIASAYTKLASALKGVNLQSGQAPSAQQLAKLQQLSKSIDQAKLTQAEQNISKWVQKNCTS